MLKQVGLGIVNGSGALSCHGSLLDTIWHAELGASAAILDAGYNLDCLLVKYQGVDWRNSSFHSCNGGVNPMWEGALYPEATHICNRADGCIRSVLLCFCLHRLDHVLTFTPRCCHQCHGSSCRRRQ